MNFISTLLAIGGALFLAVAGQRAGQTWLARGATVIAPGEVTEIREVPARNGGIAYAPVVAATLPDGRRVSFVSPTASVPAAYTPGQRVGVRYPPDHPDAAVIDDFHSLWSGALVLATVGVVLLAIGGVTAYLHAAGPATLANLNPARITGIVFAIAGPLLLVASLFQLTATLHFHRSSKTATGVVERLVEVHENGTQSFVLFPVVAFDAADRRVHFMGGIGAYPAAYAAGQQLRVRYPPAFPERARIDSGFEIWQKMLVMLGLGCVLTLLGWLLLRFLADLVAPAAHAAEAQPPFEHQLFVAEHVVLTQFDGNGYALLQTLAGDAASLRRDGGNRLRLNTAVWQELGRAPAPGQRALLLLSSVIDDDGRHLALELYPLDGDAAFTHASDDPTVRRTLHLADVQAMLADVPFTTQHCARALQLGDYLLCYAAREDATGRLFRYGAEIHGGHDGETIEVEAGEARRLVFAKGAQRSGWSVAR